MALLDLHLFSVCGRKSGADNRMMRDTLSLLEFLKTGGFIQRNGKKIDGLKHLVFWEKCTICVSKSACYNFFTSSRGTAVCIVMIWAKLVQPLMFLSGAIH